MRRKLLPLRMKRKNPKRKTFGNPPCHICHQRWRKNWGKKKRGEIPPSQLGSKGKISPPHARWRRISSRLNQLIRPSRINVLCVWRRQYVRYTRETRTTVESSGPLLCVLQGMNTNGSQEFCLKTNVLFTRLFLKREKEENAPNGLHIYCALLQPQLVILTGSGRSSFSFFLFFSCPWIYPHQNFATWLIPNRTKERDSQIK